MEVALVNAAGFAALITTMLLGVRWWTTGRPPKVVTPVVHRIEVVFERTRPKREPMPPVLLALELRRLAEELRAVEDTVQPSKAERIASCTLAYDYALREYSRSVDIPTPPGVRGLTKRQRFELESLLTLRGHDW